MPEKPSVQLRDTSTGQPHTVPLDELDAALASGQYEQYAGSTVNTNRLDTSTRVNPDQALGVISGGEGFVSPNVIGAKQAVAQQREAFNNFDDKVLTLAEGIVDAASIGLIHEHGDEADVRRDVNSGSALIGQLIGTTVGLETGGPLKSIFSGGEKAGKALSKLILSEPGTIEKIGARVLGEGAGGAALMGAGATGHSISDALIEDKPIAVEAIIHEAGMGALLGGGIGLLGEGFAAIAKGASRGLVEEGAGISKFVDTAGPAFDNSVRNLDNALLVHETRMGVLDQASKDGLIPNEFMADRSKILSEARKAKSKLDKLGSATDALDLNAANARKWQEAAEDYQIKIEALDKAMSPKLNELGLKTQELGKPNHGPLRPQGDSVAEPGEIFDEAIEASKLINNTPELKEAYKNNFGQEFVDIKPSNELDAWNRHVKSFEERSKEATQATLDAKNGLPIESHHSNNYKANWELAHEDIGESVKAQKSYKNRTGKTWVKPEKVEFDVNEAGYGNDALHSYGGTPGKVVLPEENIISILPSEAKQTGQSFSNVLNDLDEMSLGPAGRPQSAQDLKRLLQPDINLKRGMVDRPGNILPEERASIQQEVFGPGPEPAYRTEEAPIRKGNIGREGNLSDAERASFTNESEKVANDVIIGKNERFKKLMDDWFEESKATLRGTPAGRAGEALDQAMKQLQIDTKGRMDSAGSLDLAKKAGFRTPQGLLGERFQQAWSVKRAAHVAADASHSNPKNLLDLIKNRLGGRIGRMAGGAVAGKVIGGDTGSALGVALAAGYSGFTGRVAGSVAGINQKIAGAVDSLLRNGRSSIASKAIASNKAWSYSDKGPIKDPIERIQEIQYMAAHPELIENKVKQSSGDLAIINPEIHDLLTKATNQRITALSIRAPKFMWDKWGNALPPAAGEMRRFLEYENAVNDLPGTISSVNNGSITKDQADGLRDGWPSVQMKLSMKLLNDPQTLSKLPRERLQAIQYVTGVNLLNTNDGKFVERQQSGWAIANQNNEQNKPPGKPQAFKINVNKTPGTQPTVNQSFDGRAPGN